MKYALLALLILFVASPVIAAQVVTITSKDGKITKQVVTTTTEVTETDAENAATDLADAKAELADLETLKDAGVSDSEALAIFYYLEKKAFAEKSAFRATLSAEIARLTDLISKMDAALKAK